jgi:periplasmic divalent cation tolerance protein
MKALAVILTSVDTKERATSMANTLVQLKLAACVQISAVGTSVYEWQGKLSSESELYINIKTTEKNIDDVVQWLEENHPYDTPEIIVLNAKANHDYHDWLSSSLKR